MEIHSSPTQYFTSSCTSVLDVQCNNPVREGAGSIVTGHQTRFPVGEDVFSRVRTGSGKHPNIQPPPQYVPRLGSLDMKLTSPSAKYKNEYRYTFSHPHTFMACTETTLHSW
jgi:hypothetical protein